MIYYQIASKTGTVGIANELYNQDAYCAVYTSKHTIITWFGENEKSGHLPSSVNGSTYPTILAKDILNILYQDTKPSDFQIPETVVKLPIDTRSQQFNNKIEIAKTNTPERYKKEAYFAKDHLPSESTFDKPHKTTLTLYFDTQKDNQYFLIRQDLESHQEKEIYDCLGTENTQKFIDNSTTKSHIYNYYVKVRNVNNEKDEYESNIIKLLSY